ncbi:MAG: OsmC family protein [Anaerolineales bacterium]|nr:OsmC family protein [Anaerolineales bacterium]
MQAKVTWSEGLTFEGQAETGFKVPLGASLSVGGKDDGFRPMELIAIGVIGCTAMDVISILQKKRQDITSFTVDLEASRAEEHPKVFTDMKITYQIKGNNVDPKAVERAIELSETKYCPAQAMFADVFPIELEYEIEEIE